MPGAQEPQWGAHPSSAHAKSQKFDLLISKGGFRDPRFARFQRLSTSIGRSPRMHRTAHETSGKMPSARASAKVSVTVRMMNTTSSNLVAPQRSATEPGLPFNSYSQRRPWLFRLARNCAAMLASSRSNAKTEIVFRSVRIASRRRGATPGLRASPCSTSVSVITETANCNGASWRSRATTARSPRAKSLSTLVSRRYFTKRHLHAVPATRRNTIQTAACREYPATPRSASASRDCRASSCPARSRSALRINPLRVSPRFLAVRSSSLAVSFVEIKIEVHGSPTRLYNLLQVIYPESTGAREKLLKGHRSKTLKRCASLAVRIDVFSLRQA